MGRKEIREGKVRNAKGDMREYEFPIPHSAFRI
jgi:hypothetical protein